MAQVEVEIGGRRYEVSCRDGEEDRVRMLARQVEARHGDVARSIGRGNEARELLMTALLLADELDESRAAAAAQRLEEARRLTALERYADRLEALADRLGAAEA